MANTLANLVVGIGADTTDLHKGLSDARSKIDTFASNMQNVGKNIMKVGGALTLGVTLPILGAAKVAVDAASDLVESGNAVNVVYGDAAEAIHGFGKTSAQDLGMAEAEFNQLAAVTGAFLKNVGFNADQAGVEFIKLATRATDMASIFNTDVPTAMNAIQSGLKGEFNPLEQFGVKMNQAAIDAKALSMGLVETTVSMADVEAAQMSLGDSQDDLNRVANEALKKGKLTKAQAQELKDVLYLLDESTQFGREGTEEWNASLESALDIWRKYGDVVGEDGRSAILGYAKSAERLTTALDGNTSEITTEMKAQAALALIFEQTNQFAGDFANTSDGLANSTKILKAELTDASAALGLQLLPYVLKAVKFFSDLIDKFTAMSPEMQKWVLIALAGAAALGPILTIVGGLITAIGAVIPIITAIGAAIAGPMLIPILAIVAVIALLYAAWVNNWGGIQEKFAAFVAWFKPIWDALWTGLVTYFSFVWEQVKTLWEAFSLLFQGDFVGFGEKLREYWDRAWEAIKTVASGAWEFLKSAFVALVTAVMNYFSTINWGEVGMKIVMGIARGLTGALPAIISAATSVARAAAQAMKGFLGIHSPSSLMMEFGQQTAAGFYMGMQQQGGLDISKALNVPGVKSVSAAPLSGTGPVAKSGNNVTINIQNPKKETAEESIRKSLKSLSFAGAI